mmetsp:Transcript_31162/g.74311  ORF Transcript_31162/g.74311 Transcript_31162/m.74311 type:complete len:93 (-) Transcript_31162:34-312(-)
MYAHTPPLGLFSDVFEAVSSLDPEFTCRIVDSKSGTPLNQRQRDFLIQAKTNRFTLSVKAVHVEQQDDSAVRVIHLNVSHCPHCSYSSPVLC